MSDLSSDVCSSDLPYVMTVEKLAGITVPARVQTVRIMMSEFFRITSHLLFFGTFLQDVGAMSPVFFAFVDRQKAYDVIEAVTGFRMHPAWYRIGGLEHDLPQGWERLVRAFVDSLPARLAEYQKVAHKNSRVVSRPQIGRAHVRERVGQSVW